MKTKYYLAYGSNLNLPQMEMRCPDARVIGTAVIKGYELLFKGSKTGSYLTIEPNPEASVPVAVWAVSERDERCLDHYEGFPTFYYKKDMTVDLVTADSETARQITAFVYIMHEERPLGFPTPYYMKICADGYKTFGFDTVHLEKAYYKSLEEAL